MKVEGKHGFLVSVYDLNLSPVCYFYPTLERAMEKVDEMLDVWADEGWEMAMVYYHNEPGERRSELYRDIDGEMMVVALDELVPGEKIEVDLTKTVPLEF